MSNLLILYSLISITAALSFSQQAWSSCERGYVYQTGGQRLLVKENLEQGSKVAHRLNQSDMVTVTGESKGPLIEDSLLQKRSDTWYEISHQLGSKTVRGWVSALYLACQESDCPYVKVANTGSNRLLVKSSPFAGSSVQDRLYPEYWVRPVGVEEGGAQVTDSALGQNSTTWIQIEYHDNKSGKALLGWVSDLYVSCQERIASINNQMQLPVGSSILTSDEQDHKNRGSVNAWDINAYLGSPLYPIMPGKVTYAGCNNAGGYGCWTLILHDNGITSYMAHMIDGSLKVKTGQRVSPDQLIGRVGWTGYTEFGPHVHLEMLANGTKRPINWYFDPDEMKYCYLCNMKQ